VLVAALVGLHQTPGRNESGARVQDRRRGCGARPFRLSWLLFLLFAHWPLWSSPTALAKKCRHRGWRKSMAPADIATLARSGELAFPRPVFTGEIPDTAKLYWRH